MYMYVQFYSYIKAQSKWIIITEVSGDQSGCHRKSSVDVVKSLEIVSVFLVLLLTHCSCNEIKGRRRIYICEILLVNCSIIISIVHKKLFIFTKKKKLYIFAITK